MRHVEMSCKCLFGQPLPERAPKAAALELQLEVQFLALQDERWNYSFDSSCMLQTCNIIKQILGHEFSRKVHYAVMCCQLIFDWRIIIELYLQPILFLLLLFACSSTAEALLDFLHFSFLLDLLLDFKHEESLADLIAVVAC